MSIIKQIEERRKAFLSEHGTAPKHLMLGADQLKQFIEECMPALDEGDDVHPTQFSTVLNMNIVTVMKTDYLGVA